MDALSMNPWRRLDLKQARLEMTGLVGVGARAAYGVGAPPTLRAPAAWRSGVGRALPRAGVDG